MPLYEYYCTDCHGVFELLRPAREASHAQPCPECDEDASRIMSNFEAFTFRDGLPRKLPDRGKFWHFNKEVSTPLTGGIDHNEHPELTAKKYRPPAPPTAEETEEVAEMERSYLSILPDLRAAGPPSEMDQEISERSTAFTKRVVQTARQARLKRRRAPNKDTTARTVSGKHQRRQKKP